MFGLGKRSFQRNWSKGTTSFLAAVMLVPMLQVVQPIEDASANQDPSPLSDFGLSLEAKTVFSRDTIIPITGPFSVEFWFKADQIPTAGKTIFSQGNSSSARYLISIRPEASITLYSFSGVTLSTPANIVQKDTWHHIAFVHSLTDSKLYFDGQLVATVSQLPQQNWSNYLRWGYSFNGGDYFLGDIDQFKVWTTVLTPSQVAGSMHTWRAGAFTPPTANLWVHYDFNDGDLRGLNSTTDRGQLSYSSDLSYAAVSTSTATNGGNEYRLTFPRSYLTSDNGWIPPSGVEKVHTLVVAGGGSGGNSFDNVGAGGGGAGGYIEQDQIVTSTPQTVQVGLGGVADRSQQIDPTVSGKNGQDSKFGSLMAVGGGGGGGRTDNGLPGGSGGGAGGRSSLSGGAAELGQGSPGGSVSGGTFLGGAGGGGAGGQGVSVANSYTGGAGGPARTSSIYGLTHSSGGKGGDRGTAVDGAHADKNTGNGGGGASTSNSDNWGGNGGSGFVIISFAYAAPANVTSFSAQTRFTDTDADPDSVTLSWDALTDQSPNLTSYLIEYSKNSSFSPKSSVSVAVTNSTAATPNSTTITGLDDGETYHFRIKAVNAAGPGPVSPRISSVPASKEDFALNIGGDQVQVSASAQVIPASGPFTFETWIKPDSQPIWRSIVYQGTENTNRFNVYLNAQTIHVARNAAGPFINAPVGDMSGQWSHIAVTVSSSNLVTLYLNGASIASQTMGASSNPAAEFSLGFLNTNSDPRDFFDGQIDQVKVWDGELSSTQVNQSMNAWQFEGVTSAPTLRAHFDFNDSANTISLLDQVGNFDLILANVEAEDFDSSSILATNANGNFFSFKRSYLTATGGWTPPTGVTDVDYLLVGGGGGGAWGARAASGSGGGGGGGGGGEVKSGTSTLSQGQTISVTVGTGGGTKVPPAGWWAGVDGKPGGISSAFGAESQGGNGGFAGAFVCPDQGYGSRTYTDGLSGCGGASGSGFAGGNDRVLGRGGGGGGGAAGVGLSSSTTAAGVGGPGTTWTFTGGLAYGEGGAGGPVSGNNSGGKINGAAGTSNRGTGGGGGSGPINATSDILTDGGVPGVGGAGVVIVAFEVASISVTDPSDQSALTTETATFSIDASGSVGTLSYQWQVDAGSGFQDIAGANSDSYTTPAVQASDNGNKYRVEITSAINGTTTTSTTAAATLTVNDIAAAKLVLDYNASDVSSYDPSVDSSSVIDLSGKYDGTIIDAPGSSIEVVDQSFYIRDADSDYIKAADFVNQDFSDGITIDFVAKFESSGNSPIPARIISANSPDLIIVSAIYSGSGTGTDAGSIQVEFRHGSGTFLKRNFQNVIPDDGQFHRYTIVSSSEDDPSGTRVPTKLYVDGVLQPTGVIVDSNPGPEYPKPTFNSSNFLIGNISGANPDRGLHGYLRHLRIFNQPFGAAELDLIAVAYQTVSFDSSGGTDPSGLITSGSIRLPSPGEKTGYTFAGWYTDENYTELVGETGDVYTPGDLSLQAKWTANSYTITWDANGGTLAGEEQATFTTGGSIAEPANPDRSGFDFVGWSTSETSNNGDVGNEIGSWPYSPGVTQNISLYAIWDSNLTIETPTNQTATVDSSFSLSAQASGGDGNYQFSVSGTLPPGLSINSSTGVISGTPTTAGTYSNIMITVEEGDSLVDSGAFTITVSAATLTNVETPTVSVTPATAKSIDVSWTGVPNASSYTLKIYSADGSQLLQSVSLANNLTIYTINASGFSAIEDGTTYQISLQANGTGNYVTSDESAKVSVTTLASFTITYEPGSESTGSNQSETKLEGQDVLLADSDTANGWFVREGYTLTGWATTDGGAEAFALGANYTTDEDATFYPVWTGNTYTVLYEYNVADSNSSTTSDSYTTGDVATEITLPNPGRVGYTLDGWYSGVDFDTKIGDGGETGIAATANETWYAKWTPIAYSITYQDTNATGGTAPVDNGVYNILDTVIVKFNSGNLVREGYSFAGWANTQSGDDEVYGPGVILQFGAADIVLYPKWEPVTYTITYTYNEADGGELRASDSYTVGTGPLTLPVPTREGYEFAGWFDNPQLSGSPVGTTITPTADQDLYAGWSGNTYTIIYNYNGADSAASPASTQYTSGLATVTLPTPGKTGFTFAGWFESADLTGNAVSTPYTTSQNRTLHAKWEAVQYTVTYNKNLLVSGNTIKASGDVPVDGNTYVLGDTVAILANSGGLNRLGYTFVGWTTSQDGTGTALQSGQTLTMGAQDINLYPQWQANTYTITYNLNGGSGSLASAPTSWTVGTSNVSLPTSGFAKTGYTFDGWSATQGGAKISNSYNTFSDSILYARWVIKSIPYSFDKGVASGQTIANWPENSQANFATSLTLPNLAGTVVTVGAQSLLFFGWSFDGSTYAGDDSFTLGEHAPTFTAQWVQVFDVRYGFGGGTHSVAGDQDPFCLAQTPALCIDEDEITLRTAPERAGYEFAGWKVQDSSVVKDPGVTHVVSANGYLFYAQWNAIEYQFSFNSEQGSNNFLPVPGNIGQLLTLPDPGFRLGYTFAGWTPDDGATSYARGSTYLVGTASEAFVAQWIPDVYEVVFDWQGAIGTPTPDASFEVGTGDMPLPAVGDMVRDGFEFAGWSTTPGGSILTSFQPIGDDVLYAVWTDGSYTITYDPKGGELQSLTSTVPRNGQLETPAPIREGFRFLGWFDAATGGTRIAAPGETISPTSSRTFFARWVQRSLFGVDEANLEAANEFTASDSVGIDTTLTHPASGTSARVEIPAGTLPAGTKVQVRYFKDTTRQEQLISEENSYVFSVLVSWMFGAGDTATVPLTNSGKSIKLTLNNSAIKAGALIYMVIGDEITELGRATEDGSVTVELTEDPEIVLAITAPEAPRNVEVDTSSEVATITWEAPLANGGSEITGYTVTANSGESCVWTTGPLSCEITGLENGTTYTFSVIATNAIGDSTAATATGTPEEPAAQSESDSTSTSPGSSNPAITGPAAGIEAVSGQTWVWTKRLSENEVKVYIKFPEMGANYQINLQKNDGDYVRRMSKTINSTNDTDLRVVGEWYYLVRTITLPGEGRYRIEVTQDGERTVLNGENRPVVYSYR